MGQFLDTCSVGNLLISLHSNHETNGFESRPPHQNRASAAIHFLIFGIYGKDWTPGQPDQNGIVSRREAICALSLEPGPELAEGE